MEGGTVRPFEQEATAWWDGGSVEAESNGLRTVLTYLDLLRRPALVAERPYWAQRLTTSDDLDFTALIAGSDEYLGRARSPLFGRSVALTVGAGSGHAPTISGDGRYVAFLSRDGRLVPGGPRPHLDVFLLDRRVGRYSALTRGNGNSDSPDISADGSTLVFSSEASNLVAGDNNGTTADVFVISPVSGAIQRLIAGQGPSTRPSVSGDGSVLALTGAFAGTDATPRVRVAQRGAGGAVTSIEEVGGDDSSDDAQVAADGSAVVFTSASTDLDPTTELGNDAFWAALPLSEGEVVALTTRGADTIGRPQPGVSADGALVGFPVDAEQAYLGADAFVARIEGSAVVDRRRLPAGYLATSIVIGDEGTSALVSIIEERSARPFYLGQLYRPVDAEPARVGSNGDLSSDGRIVVSEAQIASLPGSVRIELQEF